MPQERGTPEQLGGAEPPPGLAAVKVENFFASFAVPQFGHFVFSQ